MTFSDELIVLNTTKLGERSLVVHSLSREYGRRSFIVSAPRSSGAMAVYMPLSVLEVEVVQNPKSDLWRLKGVSSPYLLNGIRSSVAKNAIAMFVSELLYRSLHSTEGGQELFDWCKSSILTLDALESSFANYHLRFLLEYASALGFSPSSEDLAPFAEEQYAKIGQLLTLDFASNLLLPLSGEARSKIAAALIKYLSYHLGCQLNIRSLAVLSELF